MIHLIIGLIIGAVMGLTGAGGALVAIPLFMQLLGQSLKEASLYSLVAVVLASLINFMTKRSHTKYQIGILLVIASAFGSFFTAPFKKMLPSFWIALILSLVSIYALFNVWHPLELKEKSEKEHHQKIWISVVVGLGLGALTTFTGLGGGVLMFPILLGVYKLNRTQALATSLFSVGLSSLSSLVIQVKEGANLEIDYNFIYLVVGILTAALLLKNYSSLLKEHTFLKVQQVVFSGVVFLALTKILFF